MNCIICKSASVPEASSVRETPAYDCPRCGTYRASELTAAIIKRHVNSPEAVAALSAAILKLDRHGERYPLVDIGFIQYVLKRCRLSSSPMDQSLVPLRAQPTTASADS